MYYKFQQTVKCKLCCLIPIKINPVSKTVITRNGYALRKFGSIWRALVIPAAGPL